MTVKAIETRYKGYRFRSRLEARWAVYFDAIGVAWEYEKEGFDLDGLAYLPDFWLPQVSMWAEVKPEKFDELEREKAQRLADASRFPVLMLEGMPNTIAYWAVLPFQEGDQFEQEIDYILDSSYLHEDRFFVSTGLSYGASFDKAYDIPEIKRAIEAARSARFDRTE